MIFKDYYKILGIDTNKVSIDEIKNAYREKAKKYHPDRNVGDREAEAIFKDISEAYRVLSDAKQKRKYDISWNRYVSSKKKKETRKEKKTFKEMIMDILFGGVSRKKSPAPVYPEYGEDINTEINVSLEEAFYGVTKKLRLKSVNGKDSLFTIKVPAGVQNHDKIRIVGQGKMGKNGGKNGDLFVIINIADSKKYKLSGIDIYTELEISVSEAALGTKKSISLFRDSINIIVPKCSNSGDNLVVENKGYKNGKGERGNLHIITKIILPDKLSKQQEEIFLKLRELNT